MAIVDQLEYLWVKCSHAMVHVVPVVYYGYSRPVGIFVGKMLACYGSSSSIPYSGKLLREKAFASFVVQNHP